MSNRRDYGPAGCADSCAKRGAQLALIAGVGLYSFKLMANVTFRAVMKVLQVREARR